jgi:hypothetical protein
VFAPEERKWGNRCVSMHAANEVQYARGDENIFGRETARFARSYTILQTSRMLRWQIARGWELFAEVDNLFNMH